MNASLILFTTLGWAYVPGSLTPTLDPLFPVEVVVSPQVVTPTDQQRKSCAKVGLSCAFATGAETFQDHHEAGNGRMHEVLERSVHLASMVPIAAPTNQPWQTVIVARFRSILGKEPIFIVFMDAENEQAVANKEAIRIWDVRWEGAKHIGLKVNLRPEDGFLPGRRYLIRWVQPGPRKERILAEGTLRLE